MCTAALIQTSATEFFVVFNRDELLTRAVAVPPSIVDLGGVRLVAPRDPDAGGTWIGATSDGAVLALLNNYRDAERFQPAGAPISRGVVIEWVAGRDRGTTIGDALRERRLLPRVRPFRLLMVAPTDGVLCAAEWTWTGTQLVERRLEWPVVAVSSGTRQEDAQRERTRGLADALTPEATWRTISRRMAEHVPTPGPAALCMHRPDAQTVSQTVVQVTNEAVVMRYSGSPPCVAADVDQWHHTALRRDQGSLAATTTLC